jgi:thioredoxin-dependent peroxiredoxin
MILPADMASDFTLPRIDGSDLTLSGLHPGAMVLDFNRRDETPGSTWEAPDFTAQIPDYTAARD